MVCTHSDDKAWCVIQVVYDAEDKKAEFICAVCGKKKWLDMVE